MRLHRVQVPDFRVLKNVDIEFETDFVPQVFPLGSQNGGGKSTLLQLIFILLHCSTERSRLSFLKNFIKGFEIHEGLGRRALAMIDVLSDEKIFKLEFFVCTDSFLNQLLDVSNETENDFVDEQNNDEKNIELTFSVFSELEEIQEEIRSAEKERGRLRQTQNDLKNINLIGSDREKRLRFEKILRELGISDLYSAAKSADISQAQVYRIQQDVQKRLERSEYKVLDLRGRYNRLSTSLDKVLKILSNKNILYICNYSLDGSGSEDGALLCRVGEIPVEEVLSLLNLVSNKIFLAAPSTQVFLFLSREARKLLFKRQKHTYLTETYHSHIQQAKDKLPGLFAYEFLPVDLLIDSFKAARDRDFEEAIKKGEYGEHYKSLLNSLNSMLSNKQLNLKADLSGVTFRTNEEDEAIELYPEDLSHGELKRLSIYMWLIHQDVMNSIVLMDEIEIALHPDWQYKIVTDLIQWAPTNQYVLATHSYELCQALTPAHVKELEPRLLKQIEQSA